MDIESSSKTPATVSSAPHSTGGIVAGTGLGVGLAETTGSHGEPGPSKRIQALAKQIEVLDFVYNLSCFYFCFRFLCDGTVQHSSILLPYLHKTTTFL